MTNHKSCGRIFRQGKNGRLVKRLRHQPLTLKTWVRFPYRSPKQQDTKWCPVLFCRPVRFRPQRLARSAAARGFETLLRRFRVGSLEGRSKFPYLFAARGVVWYNCSASFFLKLASPRMAIYRLRGMHLKAPHMWCFSFLCAGGRYEDLTRCQ